MEENSVVREKRISPAAIENNENIESSIMCHPFRVDWILIGGCLPGGLDTPATICQPFGLWGEEERDNILIDIHWLAHHDPTHMGSTFYSLRYHVVFGTKKRRPLIRAEWRARLHQYLGGTLRGLGVVPETVGGVQDHVHLLVSVRTTDAAADLVRELKKASSV
jgi:hypothetical protein